MKVIVEENKPFVTVRVSLDKRQPGDPIVAVDNTFVINLLKEKGIKVSNIRKSTIIDNYTTNVPTSGEWEFRNAAYPRKVDQASKSSPTPEPTPVSETKSSTPKRRRRNVSKPATTTPGSTKED